MTPTHLLIYFLRNYMGKKCKFIVMYKAGHDPIRFNSNENRIELEIFEYLVSGTIGCKVNYGTIRV